VVGPLATLRQRADGRDAAPDHAEVQRGDAEAGHRAPERLAPTGQRAGQQGGPADRQREVHRRGGGEEDRGALLARQDDRPRRPRAVEQVLAAQQRDDRRREPGQRRAGQACLQN
jgi:hypothetical protein